MPSTLHQPLRFAAQVLLSCLLWCAALPRASAQSGFEEGIATQAEALRGEDAEARIAAATYLRTLPREALPAIEARLVSARRVRPTLDEANTALTAFRRADGLSTRYWLTSRR